MSDSSVKIKDNGQVEIVHGEDRILCHIGFLVKVLKRESLSGDGVDLE